MGTLKARFEEIIHMNWDEFIALEKDKSSSVDDGVLCSLVRVCADGDDMPAIKMAFDRVDGLLETPVEVKVPKFYTRYVNAKEIEAGGAEIEAPDIEEVTDYDPASAKLRATLREMRKMPRGVIGVVLGTKKAVEQDKPVRNKIPMVKSVIVANLLKNVNKGRYKAVELVFDQIDGKLTRTITLLGGEDVYVDDYLTVTAPSYATLGEDGKYVAENKIMTAQWLRGFARSGRGLEILAEGLKDD